MHVVTVPANELNQLLENVILYSDKKNVYLREILFTVGHGFWDAYASDGYVSVGDRIVVSNSNDFLSFALSIEDAEKFLEYVKKDKKVVHKSVIKVKFKNTLLTAEDDDFDGSFQASYLEPNQTAWNIVLDLLDEDQIPSPVTHYSVNPDRFAKLARLKADKEAPVAFRGIDKDGKLLLQFKKGSTLVGCVMPVDESYIQEEFLWSNTEASPSSKNTDSAQSFTD